MHRQMECLCVVAAATLLGLLVGCGSQTRVVAVSYQNVGDNPRGRHSLLTLHRGRLFDRITSRLPSSLPPSTNLMGDDGCYETVFTVTLSNGEKRVYGPCMHPPRVLRALRATCRVYWAPYDTSGGWRKGCAAER